MMKAAGRMRAVSGAIWRAAAAAAIILHACAAAGAAAPDVAMPGQWKVFLPVDRDAPALPGGELESVPGVLEAGGAEIAGRWAAPGDISEVDGFGMIAERSMLDLAPLFGEVTLGNTAYVFIPFSAGSAGSGEIGLGADWWMQAWFNGEPVLDTTSSGNVAHPPGIDDHRARVEFREGVNVLAVRFVSGSGSSVLVAGGPGQLAELDRLRASRAGEGDVLFREDFEAGGRWPVRRAPARAVIDDSVSFRGARSLRIDSPHPAVLAQASMNIPGFEANTLYRVSFHVRKDPHIPESAVAVRNSFRAEGAAFPTVVSLMNLAKELAGEDGWTRWSGLLYMPEGVDRWTFELHLFHTQGRAWLDDVRIEKEAGGVEHLETDVWTYWRPGSPEGSPVWIAFRRHMQSRDALYRMALRYNRLLTASAFAENDLRDLERSRAYAGLAGSGGARGLFEESERWLQAAYRAYGNAYRAGAGEICPEFEAAAGALEEAIGDLEAECRRQMELIRPAGEIKLPGRLGRQDRDIPPFGPGGRMNRLLFGVWSDSTWTEMYEPLDFEFGSTAPGTPKTHTETELDFSNITERLDAIPYPGTFGYLLGFGRQAVYAPDWFMEKHEDDPDLFITSWDGLQNHGKDQGVSARYVNYLNPTVRDYVESYLKAYASFLRDEERVLYHEVSSEAVFMQINTARGPRSVGYGPNALAAFHEYLEGRYKTIGELNLAWGSDYPSFDAVQPPADYQAGVQGRVTPEEWRHETFRDEDRVTSGEMREVTPLVAEFEAFRDEAFFGYLKLVYDSLKSGDPDKPVAARHSRLLVRDINPARAFEVADIVAFHRFYPWTQVLNSSLNTVDRYLGGGRGFGNMEDHWSGQEDVYRVNDEVATRRGFEKHTARKAIWGFTLQSKWGPFSVGAYGGWFNGNWFDPEFNATTMRYSFPGMAVAKSRMEKLDWVLTHSRIARSDIAVIQPWATVRNQRQQSWWMSPALNEIVGLHQVLYPNGLLYELLPEEFVEDGRASLGEYSVVILPQAAYMSEDLQEELVKFVEDGGLLVASGRPGSHDELGRPNPLLLEAVERGAGSAGWSSLEDAWRPRSVDEQLSGGRFLEAADVGKGRVAALAGVGHLGLGSAQGELLSLISGAAGRAAWSENSLFEVVLRVAEDGGRYVFLLNNDVDRAAGDTVRLSFPASYAVDVTVDGGFPVPLRSAEGGAAFDARLGPGEVVVVYLGRE